MMKFYPNVKILKTRYIKLGDVYKPLGDLILKLRDANPHKKKDYMIFGCFMYGRKQGYKYVENFFAASYLYSIGYNIMDEMVQKMKVSGAKLLNTATDSILYSGDINIPMCDYVYTLKHYDKVEYRGQNNWTGFDSDGNPITEKHQGTAIGKNN